MALSTGADVLIMDEATTGLDQGYCSALLAWMETFLRNGGCAVWCSHRKEELERICDRCLYVQEGQMRWGCSVE